MRIALGIEYDGATFSGWQRQRDALGVQQKVESALSKIADHPVEVQCAGRTDAGVHATAQVVHFDTPVSRPDRAWTLGMNTHLPNSIAVTWVKTMDESFHARFSATARRYRYIIYNHTLRGGILTGGVTHVHGDLDHQVMHQAAQCLVGEHDFTAFRASLCQSKTPFRKVTSVSVTRRANFVIVDIQANAFLHHMVRNIVGSLVEVGKGAEGPEWIAQLLAGKDRTLAAATAKPNGLYLVDVTYPEKFGLPRRHPGPLFLDE